MTHKMISYVKVHDVETCLNALFVLSGAQISLEQLCARLGVGKGMVVNYADALICEIMKKLKFPDYSIY